MKFSIYASLIISGYVIGLCFVVQLFKFTSNEKERQKEKGESFKFCIHVSTVTTALIQEERYT